MCTLIAAWRVFEDTPICVAANRDEAVDRPSSPPRVRDREGEPAVLAPRDERAGGTWLGYNEAGLLAAVTNRWVPGSGERSRGLLVDDCLGERSTVDAVTLVRTELDRRSYAPFHLLLADGETCRLLVHDGDGEVRARRLPPGVHIVVNVGVDGEWFCPENRPEAGRRQARNAERVRAELRPENDETAAEWTARAGTVLGDHEYGVCIHGEGFGTRSSSLLRLGEERVFEFADGPPCEAAFRRVDASV
ncbi:NRDE family protein [Natronomonas sp. F2-12]|uniref:NRDE family protein n=1 Tax=Natronomonas aquatica TaxID=2841590 RepID=A0A9R1CVI1_9EURY|nr:NRDE family protein [Natronomonas aquatica]